MNGVFYYEFGKTEKFTPSSIFKDKLDDNRCAYFPDDKPPISQEEIFFKETNRGCKLVLPLNNNETIFGFGLQLKSHNQNGKKKTLRVNADPIADTGDSHAPCPMYVSTAGYAVLVDTARYASFYIGSHRKVGQNISEDISGTGADDVELLYSAKEITNRHVLVDIPTASGVGVYVFAGPDMREAVMRYNMFSGGGYMPPMWGLGIWYRAWTQANEKAVADIVGEIRDDHIPCDVIGLEPWWQTHRYPCSYVFNNDLFPNPESFIQEMNEKGFHINLWEHIFVHKESPIHETLKPYSGDYEVWGGLVPDYSLPEARKIFSDLHRSTLVDKGISGFKLDECDNSDFINSPWSFPETSEFPSGMDGEQMHCFMGALYQRAILDSMAHTGKRTLCQTRSTGPFQSDMPFVLTSDLYGHKEFICGMTNAGFCGMSWVPEVRSADSLEDLYRRMQTVILSPMALMNGWPFPHPMWKQYDRQLNKEGIFLANSAEVINYVRELFNFRMQLVPYLYTAYHNYEKSGLPPFRAMVMDYPDDPETYKCDSQYFMGDNLLVAPVIAGENERSVYLPAGDWYDFHTNEIISGGQWITIECDIKIIPIFVKNKTLLPIAEPIEYCKKDMPITINFRRFGEGDLSCCLFEDDGESFEYKKGLFNTVKVCWKNSADKPEINREGNYKSRYLFPQ